MCWLALAESRRASAPVDRSVERDWQQLIQQYLQFRAAAAPLLPPLLLEELASANTRDFLAIAQQSSDWYWHFDGGPYPIARSSTIARQLKDGARLVIYEDAVRQEVVVLQVPETEREPYKELIVFRAPSWSQPDATEDDAAYFDRELSRRRVVWSVTIVSDEAARAAQATATVMGLESGGRLMAMRSAAAESNLVVDAIQANATNVTLVVGYPLGFTNRLEIMACASLVADEWVLLATNLPTVGTNALVWSDPATPGVETRYYVVANADIDSDQDGLTDARERLIHHTNPAEPDSDGDGMPDGWELANGFDPRSGADGTADADNDLLANSEEYRIGADPHDPRDGASVLKETRLQIISWWSAVKRDPLVFTNAPGSPADLQDMKQAMEGLSGIFYKQIGP